MTFQELMSAACAAESISGPEMELILSESVALTGAEREIISAVDAAENEWDVSAEMLAEYRKICRRIDAGRQAAALSLVRAAISIQPYRNRGTPDDMIAFRIASHGSDWMGAVEREIEQNSVIPLGMTMDQFVAAGMDAILARGGDPMDHSFLPERDAAGRIIGRVRACVGDDYILIWDDTRKKWAVSGGFSGQHHSKYDDVR